MLKFAGDSRAGGSHPEKLRDIVGFCLKLVEGCEIVVFRRFFGKITAGVGIGKPAVLLLDTGADNSIVSPSVAGIAAKLDALKPEKTTGASGGYTKAKIDLRLETRHWIERPVLVMDLSEASKRLGTRIDGIVGQDILREFSAIRIDYRNSVVELQ